MSGCLNLVRSMSGSEVKLPVLIFFLYFKIKSHDLQPPLLVALGIGRQTI